MQSVRNHHRRAPLRRVGAAKPRLASLLIRGLGIAALGLGIPLVEGGRGIASDQTRPDTRSESTSKPASPAQVYRSTCLKCHDSDGRGEAVRDSLPTIPDFTNPGWHASRADEDLGRAILHGKGRTMSPMKKKLGSLDVMQMVSLVRAFQGGGVVVLDESQSSSAVQNAEPGDPKPAEDPPPPEARRPSLDARGVPPADAAPSLPTARSHPAADLYGRLCSSCHGPDGRGREARSAMPSLPDFTSRRWQTGRDNPHLAVSILEGKGTLMPAWRGRLSTEQAQDLVAYVRALGPPGLVSGGTPTSDFARRFRALQEQWDELDRRVKALSRP